MQIYHYVRGILNPTKEEVLNPFVNFETEETEAEAEEEEEEEEEEEDLNNTRREVTFVFEIDSEAFLKGVSVHDWEKMKKREDVFHAMGVTEFDFITLNRAPWSETEIITEHSSYVCPTEYEDDEFSVLFMATEQDIYVYDDGEYSFLPVSASFPMCQDEREVYEYIENEFSYGFTTRYCSYGNYDCSYYGGGGCGKCRDIW